MIANPMGQIGLWTWTAEGLKAQDPGYWTSFWTEKGYAGHDTPHLFEADRISMRTRVKRVVPPAEVAKAAPTTPGDLGSHQLMAAMSTQPIAVELEDEPGGYPLGASLKLLSGGAAGRQLWTSGKIGPMWMADGYAEAGNLRFAGVEPGDEIEVDNADFLAFCHFYRHASSSIITGLHPHSVDGHQLFPQRRAFATAVQMGPHFTGSFSRSKRMLFVQHAQDSSLWPDRAISYARAVRRVQGPQAQDTFRLRWVENAEHLPMAFLPAGRPSASTRLIEYQGAVEQSLHDLVDWVETGTPPATEQFEFSDDARLSMPMSAAERGGFQPVVRASADGAVRAEVKTGTSVSFRVEAEAPAGAGPIIAVEWDFDGSGAFAHKLGGVDGSAAAVSLTTSHSFAAPGVYFPAVRVTSHRQGEVSATGRRVMNLGRVRVVVD
jgi:hypothetical protein